MAEPGLRELLSIATDAAYMAGRRTLAYFNSDIAVETKADDTPVTRADREAEAAIIERIRRYFPTHSIVGEEGGESRGDPDYKWIIDPIDGTKSFIHGVPLYGVLIGVEIRGRCGVGVIYMPALDEMIAAADGLGCAWNGRAAKVSSVSNIGDSLLLSSSIISAMARSDAFEKLSSAAKLTRGWGDCYGYALVATGRAEIMIDPKTNPWDCAPLPPIFREAGGKFSNWRGEETIWGADGCATNGVLHEQVVAVLNEERKRALPSQLT